MPTRRQELMIIGGFTAVLTAVVLTSFALRSITVRSQERQHAELAPLVTVQQDLEIDANRLKELRKKKDVEEYEKLRISYMDRREKHIKKVKEKGFHKEQNMLDGGPALTIDFESFDPLPAEEVKDER